MQFFIQILGSGSALPTINRGSSSHFVHLCGKNYLIDCGEGTQLRLRMNKIKIQKIESIFISHLHGDHFFGLVGLISTMHLLGREKELHIYASKDLEQIICNQLKVTRTSLNYQLVFHYLEEDKLVKIVDVDLFEVYSFPLEHRIPTWGFLFKEKPKLPKLKKAFIEEQRPDIDEIQQILKGNDYLNENGEKFLFKKITSEPNESFSYVYCSDTKYTESFIDYIKDASLLYHEASFANDLKAQAALRFHSTAQEAATIASKANVKKLIIGHFSARYKEIDQLLMEAKAKFCNTIAAKDGLRIDLRK